MNSNRCEHTLGELLDKVPFGPGGSEMLGPVLRQQCNSLGQLTLKASARALTDLWYGLDQCRQQIDNATCDADKAREKQFHSYRGVLERFLKDVAAFELSGNQREQLRRGNAGEVWGSSNLAAIYQCINL